MTSPSTLAGVQAHTGSFVALWDGRMRERQMYAISLDALRHSERSEGGPFWSRDEVGLSWFSANRRRRRETCSPFPICARGVSRPGPVRGKQSHTAPRARAGIGQRGTPPCAPTTTVAETHRPKHTCLAISAMNFTNDNLVLVAPRPVRLSSTAAAPFSGFHSPIAHRPRSRAALLSAAADAFDRLRLADDIPDLHEQKQAELSDKENLSPRASPRYVSRSARLLPRLDKIASTPPILLQPPRSPSIHSCLTPRCRSTPSEALEEFLSILHHSSALRFQPTSPVLRAGNHGGAHFFYRRQTPCSLSPSLPSEGLGLSLGDADDKACEPIAYPYKLLGSSLGTSITPHLPLHYLTHVVAQGHLSLACRLVTRSSATRPTMSPALSGRPRRSRPRPRIPLTPRRSLSRCPRPTRWSSRPLHDRRPRRSMSVGLQAPSHEPRCCRCLLISSQPQ